MIRVVIVDDHKLVRAGLRRIFDEAGRFQVVGEAGSGELATELVARLNPDVVLMDLSMPGLGGLEATRRIARRFPAVGVVVLTECGTDPYTDRALDAGARGYLTKGCSAQDIVRAVIAVHRGQRYLEPGVAQRMALARTSGAESLLDRLTRREAQVFDLLTSGHSTRRISAMLCLSPKTVSTYRCRLHEKFEVDNDVMLTLVALARGLIVPSVLAGIP